MIAALTVCATFTKYFTYTHIHPLCFIYSNPFNLCSLYTVICQLHASAHHHPPTKLYLHCHPPTLSFTYTHPPTLCFFYTVIHPLLRFTYTSIDPLYALPTLSSTCSMLPLHWHPPNLSFTYTVMHLPYASFMLSSTSSKLHLLWHPFSFDQRYADT